MAAVAYALAVCKWRPSEELQRRIAAWLLVERKAGAPAVEDKGACARVPRDRFNSATEAVCVSDARLLLHAWVVFALRPGTPAAEMLPAVSQALTPVLIDAADGKGAAGVLGGSITHQLRRAETCAEVASICSAAGELVHGRIATYALVRLAKTCAHISTHAVGEMHGQWAHALQCTWLWPASLCLKLLLTWHCMLWFHSLTSGAPCPSTDVVTR